MALVLFWTVYPSLFFIDENYKVLQAGLGKVEEERVFCIFFTYNTDKGAKYTRGIFSVMLIYLFGLRHVVIWQQIIVFERISVLLTNVKLKF